MGKDILIRDQIFRHMIVCMMQKRRLQITWQDIRKM